MEKLNNEILILIFEYLPITDRVKIERVCKKWRALSRCSWSSLKKLDFRQETWTSRYGSPTYINIDHIVVEKVLRLSARYLTSVNFFHLLKKDVKFSIHFGIVRTICQLCPQIEELVVTSAHGCDNQCFLLDSSESCKNDQHKIVPWLKLRSSKLKKLGLSWFHYTDSEKDIAELFATMQELKSFYVCSADRLILGNCLEKLPLKNLEEIIFTAVSFSNEKVISNINSVLRQCSNKLHTFYLEFVELNLDSILEALLSHCNLKNLSIKNIFLPQNQRKTLLSYVSKLTQLETLNVEMMPMIVDDEFLKVVANSCKQLKELNLTHCYNITDVGISSICSLESLRCLDLAELMDKVHCPPLERLEKLEKLYCESCFFLECECLKAVIRKAPGLQIIDVRRCTLVTNELLEVAIDAAKRPGRNTTLHLLIANTKIDVRLRQQEIPALLKVHN